MEKSFAFCSNLFAQLKLALVTVLRAFVRATEHLMTYEIKACNGQIAKELACLLMYPPNQSNLIKEKKKNGRKLAVLSETSVAIGCTRANFQNLKCLD